LCSYNNEVIIKNKGVDVMGKVKEAPSWECPAQHPAVAVACRESP